MMETLICIAEDVGIRVWLERVLDGEWLLEFVSASDLSRVHRLVRASNARVAVVALDEDDPDKSARLFEALQKSNPGLRLVAVARHVTQKLLLDVMRAGARDCLITADDAERAKERLRALAQPEPDGTERSRGTNTGRMTLVVGAGAVADSRFFAQNLACELARQRPRESVLAIDTKATENHAFYFDTLSRLTLNSLLQRTDAIDESFVKTALEAYTPNLYLLSGQIQTSTLDGDGTADLFIAISRLAELFDQVVIRVPGFEAEAWMKMLGADIHQLLIVAHPVVELVRSTETLLETGRRWLGSQGDVHVVMDGYEKQATLSLAEIEKSLGRDVSLCLPMEWLLRLDSINAGVPLSDLPRRSAYQRKLSDFVRRHYADRGHGAIAGGLFRRRQQAGG